MTFNDILRQEECRYDKYINDNLFCSCCFFMYPFLDSIVRQYSKKAKRATASSNGLAGIWLYIYQEDQEPKIKVLLLWEKVSFFIQVLDDGSDELNLLWDISAIQTHYFLHKNVWGFFSNLEKCVCHTKFKR